LKDRFILVLPAILLLSVLVSTPVVAQGRSFDVGSGWRGDECLVADPTGTPLNVRQSPKGQTIGTLQNGQGVVFGRTEQPWVKVSRVVNGRLTEIGWVWRKFVDCNAERQPSRYPIFVRNLEQLVDIGVVWFDVARTQLYASRSSQFTSCPYQGEGHTLSLSNDIISSHERKGFSLAKVCLMLATGSVRYDPETGERLPTYLFTGWPDYGFFPEEFLLKIPTCFKAGKIDGMGTYSHSFKPSGCKLNYHPWTGRRLDVGESQAYSVALLVTAGGEAGPSPSPESQIRENKLPSASNASLGELSKDLAGK
jgi:hypothetical protein